jgi:hypothetical protein
MCVNVTATLKVVSTTAPLIRVSASIVHTTQLVMIAGHAMNFTTTPRGSHLILWGAVRLVVAMIWEWRVELYIVHKEIE